MAPLRRVHILLVSCHHVRPVAHHFHPLIRDSNRFHARCRHVPNAVVSAGPASSSAVASSSLPADSNPLSSSANLFSSASCAYD